MMTALSSLRHVPYTFMLLTGKRLSNLAGTFKRYSGNKIEQRTMYPARPFTRLTQFKTRERFQRHVYIGGHNQEKDRSLEIKVSPGTSKKEPIFLNSLPIHIDSGKILPR